MASALKPKELDINITSGELTYLPMPNFSYENVPTGCCMRIHEFQQMVVHQLIIVDGLMIADGTVVVLD